MPQPRLFSVLVLAGALAGLASLRLTAAPPALKKVLFFSKSASYQHDAIKLRLPNGTPGYAYAVLKKIGEENNIEFTFTKDGTVFTPESLAAYDAFFFYTSGDLTQAKSDDRGDGTPPMTRAGKAAFLAAIAAGKGFIGVHSATDTFHSPGGDGNYPPARYQDDGANADPYVRMIGAECIRHDAQQAAHQLVIDPKFPGMAAVPADFAPFEEWYTLKDFAANLHVLLVQDTTGMKGPDYARPPYPSTWARTYGQGRVFYTTMGHREDVWTNPVFQSVLTGGLNWALGRVDADVTPNLQAAAPQAGVLQPYYPPKTAAH
jgi:type 1 glutamine amidotransferase